MESKSFECRLDRLDDPNEPGTPSILLRKERFNKNYNYSRRASKRAKAKLNIWICTTLDIDDSGSEMDEDERKGIRASSYAMSDLKMSRFDQENKLAEILSASQMSSGKPSNYQSARATRSNSQSLNLSSSVRYGRDLDEDDEKQIRGISSMMAGDRSNRSSKGPNQFSGGGKSFEVRYDGKVPAESFSGNNGRYVE